MKVKLIKNKLLVTGRLFLLISTPIIIVGCQKEVTQPPDTSTSSEITNTLMPNINLHMYVYLKKKQHKIKSIKNISISVITF